MLAKDGSIPHAVPCKVDSVDTAKALCDVTPLDGSAPILDVRLQAVPGAGLLLVPSVGSIIYVHHVTPDVAIMTLPGSLQKLVIETEEASLYECIKDLIAMIRAITVATGTGPSGNVDAIPNNKLALDQLLQKLEKIFLR